MTTLRSYFLSLRAEANARALFNVIGFFAVAAALDWILGHPTNWLELGDCALGLFFGYRAGWRAARR